MFGVSMRTAGAFVLLTFMAACTGTPKKKSLSPEEMVQLDPLPLAKGAKWTYSVTVKRFDPDTDKETTKALQWVTEVIDAREGNGVTAYRVKGWPSDLEASADDQVPVATERTLLRYGNSFMWGTSPDPTLDGAEGWFKWPLYNGQKICPSAEMAYCWVVSMVETGYALTFYTGPDEQTFELEPGTGVSRFHYAHHGTTNEVEAKLTSYSPGRR
jgi:hypothetical protein